ncbi:PIN domain-containing protein [uncultured Methanospirillum sp.]|uniref:type II toxin-antitoxin system VapC family toxin n=1 Tax=uncultured Methanospirillum sp. TaxID=262503 RepID=UPI0029C7103E|nr:PIN domain-containing protein [uncultured Methanospirillum sp.]
MRSVFIDTSFVIAIFTPEDKHHKQALEIAHELFDYTEIWITDAIIYEIGNSFSKTGKQIIAEFIRDCYTTEQMHVVKTDEPLLMKALTHYSDYLDKDWSLTDCLSFEVMKEKNIAIAYSSDHHFEQAGFQYVLR